MKIAIPLFGDEISPNFCFAQSALVVDWHQGRCLSQDTLPLTPLESSERLTLLQRMGVTVLLCGGLNRRLLPLTERMGFQLYWGLYGKAEDVLQSFLRGELCPISGEDQAGSRPGQTCENSSIAPFALPSEAESLTESRTMEIKHA